MIKLNQQPDDALQWLIDTEVSTLMRIGECSRYDVMQVQKLARAELTARRLLAGFAETQRLRELAR